jgi:hypothetical protein
MENNLIKQLEDQISNLETIVEVTNVIVTIPEESFLTDLYKNLKTFSRDNLCDFLQSISTNNNINPDNKQFNNIKDDQRKVILDRLKEKLEEVKKVEEEKEAKKVENKTE